MIYVHPLRGAPSPAALSPRRSQPRARPGTAAPSGHPAPGAQRALAPLSPDAQSPES